MLQDRRGQYCQRQPQELLVQSEEVLFALYAGLLVTSFSPYLLFCWQLLSWSGSYGMALTTWLKGVGVGVGGIAAWAVAVALALAWTVAVAFLSALDCALAVAVALAWTVAVSPLARAVPLF